jgi:hypothetical protein
MQGKTRAGKPKLELGLDTITRRKKLIKTNEVVEDVKVRLDNCLNVEPIVNLFLGILEVEAQLGEEAIPSKLNKKTPLGTKTVKK